MQGKTHRGRGETRMLGEVVADHREPVGVTVTYVEDSGTRNALGERGHASAKLPISHWEGSSS
ncbi:hypothetical protein [Streptomyces sp. NBC_01180]|uniref:hypothetical protein n=1 Tax=Streptomyces sp. NBC_01180 TaxID=2903763 RepID=UPI003864BD58|nr:hypothetical protein OG708_13200 [Streptomyces sp. NBC_01180]